MLGLGIERIGKLAVVECKGRIVSSETAFKLRRAVTSLEDSRIVVLDLSEVSAIDGSGLGILLFLERWAFVHEIQFKLFHPTKSVRERLELVSSIRPFDIAPPQEMIALLANADSHLALTA